MRYAGTRDGGKLLGMAREDAIVNLIVEAVVEERPFKSLVEAYIDERLHDEDAPQFESTRAMEQWMRTHLDMLYGRDEVESVLRAAYLRVYKRIASWSSGESFGDYALDKRAGCG